jgi:DNA-binding CsgD family transcriptional regulator
MNQPAAEHASLELDRLSPAERRVADLALAGRSAREIAELLVLSEATIRSHLSRIYSKLGVSSQVELLGRAASARPAEGVTRDSGSASAVATSRRPSGPMVLLLVGLTLLSVIPPVAIVVGPGLLVTAWLAGRRPDSHPLRNAQPWLLVLGVIITLWAAFTVLGMLALLGAGSGGGMQTSPVEVRP